MRRLAVVCLMVKFSLDPLEPESVMPECCIHIERRDEDPVSETEFPIQRGRESG